MNSRITLALICSFFSVPPVLAGDKLAESISFESPSSGEYLELCSALRMMCAIEISVKTRRNLGPLTVRDVSGREAANMVTARYPGHKWRIINGVFTVTPLKPVLNTPLDRHLGKIDFQSKPIGDVWGYLLDKGGFSFAPRNVAGAIKVEPRLPSISLTGKNPTSREILTRAIKQHGNSMWQVEHLKKANGQPSFYLEVVSYAPNVVH